MLIKINKNTYISKYQFLSEVRKDFKYFLKAKNPSIDLYYESIKVNYVLFTIFPDKSEKTLLKCLDLNWMSFDFIPKEQYNAEILLKALMGALNHKFNNDNYRSKTIRVILNRVKVVEFSDINDCIKKLQNKIKLESLINND